MRYERLKKYKRLYKQDRPYQYEKARPLGKFSILDYEGWCKEKKTYGIC